MSLLLLYLTFYWTACFLCPGWNHPVIHYLSPVPASNSLCLSLLPQHCFCLLSLIPLTHSQLNTPSVDDCQLKGWCQIWTPFPFFIQTTFVKEHHGLLRDINRRVLHNTVCTVKTISKANNSLGLSVNGCSNLTLHSVFQRNQHAIPCETYKGSCP